MAKQRKRKQRRHGVVAAGFQARKHGASWIPAPGLRKAGWIAGKLTADDGTPLTQGAALDLAHAINAQVAAWREGKPVDPAFKRFAPKGACAAEPGKPRERGALDTLSIGALIDAYTGNKDLGIEPSNEFAKDISAGSQRDYRGKLKRLVDALAGWVVLPVKPGRDASPEALADYERQLAEYREDVADTRALPVFVLEPAEGPDGIVSMLYDAYQGLREHSGVSQASGVFAVAKLWLNWCRDRKSRRIHNWAAEVKRETPQGRIRPLTWEETLALIKAAETLGWHSIADAIILGVDLSWSQIDRLKLTWGRVKFDGEKWRAFTARQKTGRVGGTPFLKFGERRLKMIQTRQAAMAAQPTHVIWCETTNAPWKSDHYRHTFAEIRALAAQECPSVLTATDADLRDTAVTFALDSDLSVTEIASRTLQSLDSINTLIQNHYGQVGRAVADRGADKLNAYLETLGVAL